MTHESTNGDAATARLMRTVVIVLVIVVTGVTLVSIFSSEASQKSALSTIEKLLAPVLTALVGYAISEIAKVKHIVNSKSDKQDAKIADLEKQISEGRQSKVDEQQQVVADQQTARGQRLDERDAKAAIEEAKPTGPIEMKIVDTVVVAPAISTPDAKEPA